VAFFARPQNMEHPVRLNVIMESFDANTHKRKENKRCNIVKLLHQWNLEHNRCVVAVQLVAFTRVSRRSGRDDPFYQGQAHPLVTLLQFLHSFLFKWRNMLIWGRQHRYWFADLLIYWFAFQWPARMGWFHPNFCTKQQGFFLLGFTTDDYIHIVFWRYHHVVSTLRIF
jgi:hypothetical protein